jgi:hypothetical protein
MNLSCGHDPVKVIRFSTESSDADKESKVKRDSSSIAVISMCQECWDRMVSVITASVEMPQAKYVDSPEVNRVFIPKEPEGE